MEVSDRLAHLLPHWIEHNEAHVQQLQEWIEKARAAGMIEVADAIGAAAAALEQANARLAEARGMLPA